MATVEQARSSLKKVRQQLETERERIRKTRLRDLSREELQRRTQTEKEKRKVQSSRLEAQKQKALEQFKPAEKKIEEYESQIGQAEAINRRIEEYQLGIKASEKPIDPQSSKAFQEGQRAGRLKSYFIIQSSGAKISEEIKEAGGKPIISGGKIIGAEIDGMSFSLEELSKGINIPQTQIQTSELEALSLPGKTSQVKTDLTIQDVFQKTRKEDVLTNIFSSKAKQLPSSIDVPTSREKVSKFFGVNIPRPQQIMSVLTGKKPGDTSTVKETILDVPRGIYWRTRTAVQDIFGLAYDSSKLEKIKINIPETTVPQKVTSGGEFKLEGETIPFISKKQFKTSAGVGFDIGALLLLRQAPAAVTIPIRLSFVGGGISDISKGDYLKGIVDIGFGLAMGGSKILSKTRKIIKEPVPKPEVITSLNIKPSINKEGKLLFKGDLISTSKTPARFQTEKSILFEEKTLISKSQTRKLTGSLIGNQQEYKGIAVETRVGKSTPKSLNIYKLEGKTADIGLEDFSKLPKRQQKSFIEGVGEGKILKVGEEDILFGGESITTKLFKITKKGKGVYNVKLPKPGETTTRLSSVGKTKFVGKTPLEEEIYLIKSASQDITKTLSPRKIISSKGITKIGKTKLIGGEESSSLGRGGLFKATKTNQKLASIEQQTKTQTERIFLNKKPVVLKQKPTQKISKPTIVSTSIKGTKEVQEEIETEILAPKTLPSKRENLLDINIVDKDLTTKLNQTPIISPIVSNLFSQEEISSNKPRLTFSPISREFTKLNQDFIQEEVPSLFTLTIQESKQISPLVSIGGTTQKTKTPKPTPTQRLTLPPISKKESPTIRKLKKLRAENKGVNIEVGMKIGKKKIIRRNMHPFKALRKAQEYVDKNIEASFRLVPSGKKPKGKKGRVSKVRMKFRPSKSNALYLVEKKKYRLDNPGEKKQIKNAPKKKNKKRKIKKKSWLSI